MSPEEILKIRIGLGLTQERFAQLIGATVVTINRWENGRAKPSRLYIKHISEVVDGLNKHSE